MDKPEASLQLSSIENINLEEKEDAFFSKKGYIKRDYYKTQ